MSELVKTPTQIIIPKSVHSQIISWANQAYPHEGCGLLIGQFKNSRQKQVVRLAPLENLLLTKNVKNAATLPANRQGPGAGKTEFVMSPEQFNQESIQAEKEGYDVVGVIHTHPDHPPRPSQIDSSQPFLAQWSNIIVSVDRGVTKEMKSWFREIDSDPFEEESILIQ